MNKSEQLIACLEGEIAKRDAELAACRVAVENCEVFRARIAELEARIVWLECEAQVNAAPVSEAKAQGDAWAPSVNDYDHSIHSNPDAREWADFFVATFPGLADKHDLMIGWFANAMMAMHDHLARKAQGVVIPSKMMPDGSASAMREDYFYDEGWNDCIDEVARLNSAPAEQVSVPASAFASRAITHYEAALLAAFPSGSSGEVFNQWNEARRVLAAAPAAPAADACKACKGTGRRPIGGRGRIFGLTNRCFECQPLTDEEVYGQVTAHD